MRKLEILDKPFAKRMRSRRLLITSRFVIFALASAWLWIGGSVAAAADGGGDGSPFLVKSWTTADGLPQNSVETIAQTADGYLWAGTRGGLARFDGVQFTTYGLADGLKSVYMVDLLDDGQNGLWIGTSGGGLSHYREGAITTFTTSEGLAQNSVLALAMTPDGSLWVGGDRGLQRFEAGLSGRPKDWRRES